MFPLYAKLGFHKATVRSSGMFHIAIFPRRLDRKVIPGASACGGSCLRKMPRELREYWEDHAFHCISRSKARVAIVPGHSAARVYQVSLAHRGVHYTTVWISGAQRYKDELPCAWFEFESSKTNADLSRVVFGVYHPEGFLRNSAAVPGPLQRNLAFRKRLIDLACVFLYGEPQLPAFLSTSKYFWQMSTGIIIPVDRFEQYNKKNDTLSEFLNRPTLNFHTYGTMNNLISSSSLLMRIQRCARNILPNFGGMALSIGQDGTTMYTRVGQLSDKAVLNTPGGFRIVWQTYLEV